MSSTSKSFLEEQADKLVLADTLQEAAFNVFKDRQIRLAKEANEAHRLALVLKISAEICKKIDDEVLQNLLKLAEDQLTPVPFKKPTLNTFLNVVVSDSIIMKPESAIIPENFDELVVVPNAIQWIMDITRNRVVKSNIQEN